MFQSQDNHFNRVKDFHLLMDGKTQEIPKAFSSQTATNRADFKLEELVEFLRASVDSEEAFDEAVAHLHLALDKAAKKVKEKIKPGLSLVGQVDALLDLLYFTYGSFVLMGVDSQPIFEIVHTANMGKIFPDGQAHFDPLTHKILKPADWEEKFAPELAILKELEKQTLRTQQD